MKRKDFIDKYDLANAKVLTEDQELQMIQDLAKEYVARIKVLPDPCTTIRMNQCVKEFEDFIKGIENKTVVSLTNVKVELIDKIINPSLTHFNS